MRNQQVVAFARFYGVTVHTCEVRDPASKGGVENTVKLAKADIVPTDTNLAEEYACFADLEAACTAFMTMVNGRVHRTTKRVPADMLEQERLRLHPVPAVPAHGHVRGNPDGRGEHPDGVLPGRVLLGAAHPARGDGVGAGARRRPRRTGGDRARR